jgi:type IV pilus assembly protein PilF
MRGGGNMRNPILIRIFLLTILVGIGGCGPTLEERRQKANTQIEIAVAELKREKFAEALKAFEKARKIYPDDPQIYNGIGLIYLHQQQYQKAIEEFNKAVRVDPNFTDAHNNLGTTYAYLKQWDNAIAEFKITVDDAFYRALDLARYNLGLALMEKGDLVEAVKEFHTAVQINPKFSRAVDKYGVALFRLNRLQESIKQFKQAIELDAQFIDPYLNLGLAYMKQGKKEDAIAQFKLVLERSQDEELTAEARRYLEILE